MHLIKSVTTVALFLLIPGFMMAQKSIEVSGRVLEIETNEPLIGVNVQVVGTTFGGGTDARGYFHLRFRGDVPYKLRFSMIGYKPAEVEVLTNPKSGIRVRMQPQTYVGEEVIVTAPVVEVEQKTIRPITMNRWQI